MKVRVRFLKDHDETPQWVYETLQYLTPPTGDREASSKMSPHLRAEVAGRRSLPWIGRFGGQTAGEIC